MQSLESLNTRFEYLTLKVSDLNLSLQNTSSPFLHFHRENRVYTKLCVSCYNSSCSHLASLLFASYYSSVIRLQTSLPGVRALANSVCFFLNTPYSSRVRHTHFPLRFLIRVNSNFFLHLSQPPNNTLISQVL